MVRLNCADRVPRHEVALLGGVLNRKRGLQRILLVLKTGGQGLTGVDQIIEVAHRVVVFEDGRYRIVLKQIPSIRTAGISSRTGNKITAVGELKLKYADRYRIEIEQWVRHRSCWTLDLNAAVRGGVVQICRAIARRFWA